MTTVVIVAALSATCTVLIAIAWNERTRATRATVRAEEADRWSQWFQEAAEVQATQLRTINAELSDLRRQHGRLQARYTDLVRSRLVDNYAIIDRNISGRSRMS